MNRESIKRKLVALTEGEYSPLYRVTFLGNLIRVNVQPWGSPMVLTWSQAEAFTKDMPLVPRIERKAPQSETAARVTTRKVG